MVDETAKYKFTVKDFKPETMPFGRLVEYYAELAKMIGQSENMHLVDIVESSHGSQFKIDRHYEAAVTKRLKELSEGNAPNSSIKARDRINEMLTEDSTSGEFSDPVGENVIQFPGNSKVIPASVRIHDAATFTGELYYIAGNENEATVRIETELYNKVFCKTSKEIAKSLRDFLFEKIKVNGRGMWVKGEDGKWLIENFSITDFTPVRKENLRDAVDHIRSLPIDWPKDAIAQINELNEKVG